MREEGHVRTEAEIEVMQLQATERHGLTAASKSYKEAGKDSIQRLRGSVVLLTP